MKTDDPLQIRTMFFTDPEDSEGPCMAQLQVWPIPQDIMRELIPLLDRATKQFLKDKGLTNGAEINILAVGPMQ